MNAAPRDINWPVVLAVGAVLSVALSVGTPDTSGYDIGNWFFAKTFLNDLDLADSRQLIATEILKEIRGRLDFLSNVGLDYLQLERTAPTLSGGETQRIRLAGQIGCGLVGVLYFLDEPSIGLHSRDNR